jgi:replication factor C subunit 1
MLNTFDACQKLLSHERLSTRERLDLYFIDFQIMPLFVHQNYLSAAQNIQEAADAAEYLSTGDLINSHVMCQNWALLPNIGMCMVCAPSVICSGRSPWAKFPEVWPKMSVLKKTNRMLREIKQAIGSAFQANR